MKSIPTPASESDLQGPDFAKHDELNPRLLWLFAGLFVCFSLVSNIAAVKLFSMGPAVFAAAILIFPISYVLGDVLVEVYGSRWTSRVINVGVAAILFMLAVLWIAIKLPPAPGWTLQDQFAAVHEVVPRIAVGSIIAYWCGQHVNKMVMASMKRIHGDSKLGLRMVASTAAGEFVDTGTFVVIAFAGTMPPHILIAAAISGWVFKTVYEIVVMPVTYVVIRRVKRHELAFIRSASVT
jgi:uncharacterized integral membrane protein (TIGR00697 family)